MLPTCYLDRDTVSTGVSIGIKTIKKAVRALSYLHRFSRLGRCVFCGGAYQTRTDDILLAKDIPLFTVCLSFSRLLF